MAAEPAATSASANGPSTTTPFILFLCHPLTGHLTPSLRVASSLHSRGHTVFFLGPTAHRSRISASGAVFLPLQGTADIDDLLYYSPDSPRPPVPGYHALSWSRRAVVDLQLQWIDPIPDQWASVRDALAHLARLGPARGVVVVCEAVFHGLLPLFRGAPLPDGVAPPIASLCLSVTVPLIRSADLPPFGFPLPFDPSPAGRARNAACWEAWNANSARLRHDMNTKLKECGATTADIGGGPLLSGQNYLCHDAVLQLGVPGFFYPRSDWPAKLQITGIIPPARPSEKDGWGILPEWWDEVVTASRDGTARVVVVAQGTVETNPGDLILPVVEALAERPDVLAVAILGRRGARLPSRDSTLPRNARVVDYLHYDAVLPHAHVWVHNAGYGAVTHGIAHGVPMVVGGEGQDKGENARRIAHCGAGVDLGTATPRVAAVKRAIDAVLDDPSYAESVRKLRKEAEELDCFDCVHKAVTAAGK